MPGAGIVLAFSTLGVAFDGLVFAATVALAGLAVSDFPLVALDPFFGVVVAGAFNARAVVEAALGAFAFAAGVAFFVAIFGFFAGADTLTASFCWAFRFVPFAAAGAPVVVTLVVVVIVVRVVVVVEVASTASLAFLAIFRGLCLQLGNYV